MRTQGLVDLGNRTVKILEFRVRDARALLDCAKKYDQVDISGLLTDHFDELAQVLGDCIEMPQGETLDDLTFSEVILVKKALLEVNKDFLEILGLSLSPAHAPEQTEPTILTESVSA
ncbi:MAG: hypothetical protein ACXWT1_05870 [Methylobacter sp.]